MVDPRRTESAERYEHLSIQVGSDIWLLSAMLNLLFTRGYADEGFLNREVSGWRELRQAVIDITPERAAQHCGIAADTIVNLTEDFYRTPRSAMTSRTGICRNEFATLANVLVDAVNIIAGKFSTEGGVMQGYRVFGDYLPQIPEKQSRIGHVKTNSGFWMPSVVMADEILEDGPGKMRGFFMVAGNPVTSAPGGEKLKQALSELELFVACDLFVNESNQYADYILPTTTFLERANIPTVTFEHMIKPVLQYAKPVINALGEARTEEWIFDQLMQGVFGKPIKGMESAIDKKLKEGEYGSVALGGFDGLSLDALKAHPGGLSLPEKDMETRWRESVFHSDAKLHLWHDDFDAEFYKLKKINPQKKRLKLFGRRDPRSMNGWLHNVERLVRSQKPTLLIHPEDAEKQALGAGDMAEVSNQFGRIEVEVEISEEIHPGSINYPHGWGHEGGWRRAVAAGGANVNVLSPTDASLVEALSGSSILDGIEVELKKIS